MNGAPRPVLPATPARQGRWGRHMAWVLVVSLLLATVALAAAWAWRAGDFTRAQHRISPTRGEAASFHQ